MSERTEAPAGVNVERDEYGTLIITYRPNTVGGLICAFADWRRKRSLESACTEPPEIDGCRDEVTMARESGDAADEFLMQLYTMDANDDLAGTPLFEIIDGADEMDRIENWSLPEAEDD